MLGKFSLHYFFEVAIQFFLMALLLKNILKGRGKEVSCVQLLRAQTGWGGQLPGRHGARGVGDVGGLALPWVCVGARWEGGLEHPSVASGSFLHGGAQSPWPVEAQR